MSSLLGSAVVSEVVGVEAMDFLEDAVVPSLLLQHLVEEHLHGDAVGGIDHHSQSFHDVLLHPDVVLYPLLSLLEGCSGLFSRGGRASSLYLVRDGLQYFAVFLRERLLPASLLV